MAKKNEPMYSLPTVDDIFTTQEIRDEESLEKVMDIPLEDLMDFHSNELGRQPFRVDEKTESFQRLYDSINNVGFLQPALAREDAEHPGKYELVAGMRRKRIGELLQFETLPCIIRQMDDDTANIIVTDTNEYRDDEEILPSEKAWAYRIRLEAMKRQGMRTDLTSAPVEPKLRSNEELSRSSSDSVSQIKRYIRLTYLIPDILNMVDDRKIALRPAVEISYLPEKSQEELLDAMIAEDCTPSHAQTIRMRQMLDAGKLTGEAIYAVMSEEKPNQKDKIILHTERVGKLIPKGIPMEKREEYIVKALEHYSRHRQKQKEKQEQDAR